MSRLDRLTGRLAEDLADLVADVHRVRGHELHCSARPAAMPALARSLRGEFGAELVFMAAADRRTDRGTFEVHYLFAPEREHWFVHVTAPVPAAAPAIVSLATLHYPASRFEREIYDLFGIVAEGHPDPRPLVRHGFWPADYFPLRKDATPREFEDDGRAFPFTEVGGEGVYEIPVGPVHAGVIEPGHFRFSVVGETIIDMKSRLYFTHKGTEKLFEGREAGAGVELAERVSGDTTVGHSLAFCQALEAAGCEIIRCAVPVREAAEKLGEIKKKIRIPLVADIHFNYKLALIAIEQGVDGLRLNPGNIGARKYVEEVVKAASERKIPIRIGVNGGSLEKDLLRKYGTATPEAARRRRRAAGPWRRPCSAWAARPRRCWG